VQWQLFGTTFALIFISELPDKTAFATLLLAAQGNPLAVFLGAAGAFVVQSLVAVTFGRLFSALPERVVHIGAGVVFLVLAILMWRKDTSAEEVQAGPKKGFFQSAASAFVVIFIAEWGDLTQLATATLAAKYEAATLTIFVSATLALWVVTGIGVVAGHFAGRSIQPKHIQVLASITFAIAGIVLLIQAR
jgi:putative Ca2+/H+ antiporter (TMEM165/GDT1 family)